MILPLRIAFELDHKSMVVIDYVIDSLFGLDILLNFNTTYDATPDSDTDNIMEVSRYNIAKRYLTSWFLIDVVSTVPFDDITVNSMSSVSDKKSLIFIRTVRILRMVKLLKLFRVLRLKKLLELLEDMYISPAIVSIISLVIQIVFLAHLICCFWYYLAIIEPDNGNNWLVKTHLDEAAKGEAYVASIYFVITTMVSVGYGDFRAYNTSERFYGCFVILFGAIMFGAIITKVTKLILNRNPQATKLKAKLDDLKGYMNEKKLPEAIKLKCISAYAYYMRRKSLISESG